MKTLTKFAITFALSFLAVTGVRAQDLIANVYGREMQSLNGKWDAVVDLYDQGRKNKIYLNRKPEGKTDFYEYAFVNGLRLDVPSDWNSQTPELKYYEGTVWYARRFDAPRQDGRRLFLHFGAVSYRCRVYLNGEEIGSHEGGFTPFQIEVTGKLKPADNFLAVEVNNTRTPDAIPAMAFDWWNYGGITRDVSLVCVPEVFVEDYFIRLDKDSADRISADVRLSGAPAGTSVLVEIPELKVRETASADERGAAALSFRVKNLETLVARGPETLPGDRFRGPRPGRGDDRFPQRAGRGRGHLSQRRARVPQIGQLPRGDTAAHGPRVLRVGRRDAVVRGPGAGL